jgi:hypothetical protein
LAILTDFLTEGINSMNASSATFSPPRTLALVLSGFVFATYQWGWRPELVKLLVRGEPVSLPFAIGFSLILGYAVAMLWWLLRNTQGQWIATFSPTRGRVVAAFCLAAIAPVGVAITLPVAVGFLLLFMSRDLPTLYAFLLIFAASYFLAAMIIRHTYQRRLLRLGLFMLSYWAAYAIIILWNGVVPIP